MKHWTSFLWEAAEARSIWGSAALTDVIKQTETGLFELKLLQLIEIMTLTAPPLSDPLICSSNLLRSLREEADFIQVGFVFDMQTLNATQALRFPVIIIHLRSSAKRNIRKAHIWGRL